MFLTFRHVLVLLSLLVYPDLFIGKHIEFRPNIGLDECKIALITSVHSSTPCSVPEIHAIYDGFNVSISPSQLCLEMYQRNHNSDAAIKRINGAKLFGFPELRWACGEDDVCNKKEKDHLWDPCNKKGENHLAFVRDPFAMLVSAVNYHASGFEPGWTDVPVNSKRPFKAGLRSVIDAASSGLLPTLEKYNKSGMLLFESYAAYLRRIDVADALRVERTRQRDPYVDIEDKLLKIASSCIEENPGALVCLEDHMNPETPLFNQTMRRVLDRTLRHKLSCNAKVLSLCASVDTLLGLFLDVATRGPDFFFSARRHSSKVRHNLTQPWTSYHVQPPKILDRDWAMSLAEDIDRIEYSGVYNEISVLLKCNPVRYVSQVANFIQNNTKNTMPIR